MIGGGAEISGSERLDDVDMRIVRLLQENGRRAAAEIARMVRLSQPAVKNRIDRLVDRGVCKIVGVIDPGALGLAAGALVYMRTEPERLVEIGESLARMPAISWLCHTTGEFDILAEVHMAGAQEVLEFVDRTIAAIPGIRSTEVSLVVGHSGWRPTAWCPLST